MNKFLLWLILLPKGLWRLLGADLAQLKAILSVKLKLDDRKPLAFGRQRQNRKKPARFMSFLSVFISVCVGFMYIFPLMSEDSILGLWLYFSVFLVMLSILLITDFSTVLFDTRDKYVLLPRPVSERTLLLSRLLHMLIYLLRIVVPMSLGGWVIIGLNHGWKAVLWFPFAVLMLTFMALFFVMGVYLLLLRFLSGEKFKDVINYFQIAFSVLFFASAYLMPRVMTNTGFQQLHYTDFAWAKFTPTFWLAASSSFFTGTHVSAQVGMLSVLAVLVPMLMLWFTVKFLSPGFGKRIAALDGAASPDSTPAAVPTNPVTQTATPAKASSGKKFYLRLAERVNKTPLAKAGFIIAWLQTDRSRNFKMRVYPTFAYVPVYFFYITTQTRKPLAGVWHDMPSTDIYVLLLYMTSFIVLQLLSMLVFSEQYKASWIYYSSPVPAPGSVMGGAFKAVWIKYFLPVFAVIAAFVLYVWGPAKIADILLAFVNITIFGLCIVRVAHRRLPFSAQEQMNEKGNRFLKTLFIMVVPFSMGFGHYWAASTPFAWLKYLFLVLSSVMLWLIWDSYKSTDWASLKKMDL